MTIAFTPREWATLYDLAERFEKAPGPSTSKERRELRAAMRAFGFKATEFGLTNTTRAALQKLLDKGLVRIVG
jgi:hypothetical protein